MAPPADRRFFFVHVMKTAGTTLNAVHLAANFSVDETYPHPDLDPGSYDLAQSPYWQIDRLRALPEGRKASIRAYTGHFPYVASELVGGPDLVTYTLLRDPIDRVVSYLKHCATYHPQHQGLSLDAIYDDRDWMRSFAHDFQVRMFAFTADDEPSYCYDPLAIDDDRFRVATDNLDATTVVGVQERFADLVDELVTRFGWSRGEGSSRRVSESADVSSDLRRRIEADNEADIAFYRHAQDLVRRRRG